MALDGLERLVQIAQHLIGHDFVVPLQIAAQLFGHGISHELPVKPFILHALEFDIGDTAALTVDDRVD